MTDGMTDKQRREAYRKKVLRTRYTSGLFTIILPVLIFLAVWAGVYFLPILLGWPLSDWMGLLPVSYTHLTLPTIYSV